MKPGHATSDHSCDDASLEGGANRGVHTQIGILAHNRKVAEFTRNVLFKITSQKCVEMSLFVEDAFAQAPYHAAEYLSASGPLHTPRQSRRLHHLFTVMLDDRLQFLISQKSHKCDFYSSLSGPGNHLGDT